MPIRYEYDAQLQISEKEYANGRAIRYQRDERGNPTTITHGYYDGSSTFITERTIVSQYHEILNTPLSRSEASVLGTGNKETIWDYDDDGGSGLPNENPTLLVHRKIDRGYTKDQNGITVSYEYVITYSYNSQGQLISIDGPVSGTDDTTLFSYDAASGDLLSVSQPLIGTITFGAYDNAGNPGSMTDVNGRITNFTYDGRNRILSTDIEGVINSRLFNLAGDLASITDAGGRTRSYAYYGSGRLQKIIDSLGQYLSYGYDAQGNRTEEFIFDSTDSRKSSLRYDFNNPADPGKLWRIIYPDPGGITEYAYDEVGNLSSVTDPLNRVTSYQYDELNRLQQMIRPGTNTTGYDYDSQGNLTSVTDPGGKQTQYEVDDMGRVVSETSPDSGLTTYVYDVAANTMTATDANNITATYSFDALGRLTGVAYPDAADNVSFTYDQGTDGKGRLTAMTDGGGSASYTYTALGQLQRESRTNTGTAAVTTVYGYDLTTTPSGDLESIT